MKNLALIIAAALTISACKSANNVTKTPANNLPNDTSAPVSNSAFFNAVEKKSNFDQVKINSKINVEMGQNMPTADATFYIENGKKVWLNISAAFLNIARGIATPQGIQAYEKFGKTYIESDFSYLNKLLNVSFINYDSFQNLLLGKTFIPVNDRDFTLTKNAQGYSLNSNGNQTVTVDGKTTSYTAQLDYNPNFDLSSVNLRDISSGNDFQIQYSNWTDQGATRFPKNVKIIIKGQKNGQILIENTKFDFAKMETPYSVPANYTKKEIR